MTSLLMAQRPEDRRLWLACAVAGLFHLLLMFGLRIGSEPAAASSLEVTLVASPGTDAKLAARVLAPVAQAGAGYRHEARQQQGDTGKLRHLPGLRHANDLAMLSAQTPGGNAPVITTTASSAHRQPDQPWAQAGSDDTLRLLRQEQAGDPTRPNSPVHDTQPASDDALRAGARLATRASAQAAYRELWRQRVERAGAANFPWSALAMGRSQSLTLETTVRADGTVTGTRIRQSSGSPMLDRAALDILRKAGPFPPFPEELKRETAELGFVYNWEFLPGDRAALRVGP